MKATLITVLCLALLAWFFLPASADIKTGPVNVTAAPVQNPTSAPPFAFKGYTLTPLADFSVSARVLSKSIYRLDRESALAPVDLALGWQSMAKPEILSKFSISQGNRFYHWYTDNFPIPRNDVETQSANMHMIPSTDAIEDQLKAIPEGKTVRITGYLVGITTADGWHWDSSMTRGDTGAGACEVIYVTDVVLGK